MGVDVSGAAVGAFLALILALILVGAGFYARRRGHLQSRPALIAFVVIVFLLAAYGMTGGFFPGL